MLSSVAQRGWLLAVFAFIVIAIVVAGAVRPVGFWAAVIVGVVVFGAGVGALALVRLLAAIRELYRNVADLNAENAALKASVQDGLQLRARLALAERRLAALAIKLQVTDELDEPGA